ncbi:MAG: hypothetical protein J5605_06785 [Bacteroidales bacterium]|nr:hypothetical protein [Bacteroidales bacterium]
MFYSKQNNLAFGVILLLLTLLLGCSKEVKQKNNNMILSGKVLDFLDQCHGNEIIISVDSSFNVGSYSNIYGTNVIAIPYPGRVRLGENGEAELVGYNYLLYNGEPTGLPMGGFISFEARPYNPESSDTSMYTHNMRCPIFEWPIDIQRFVVTKIISIND